MIEIPTWTPAVWTLLAPLLMPCGMAMVILAVDLARPGRPLRWAVPVVVALAGAALLAITRWGAPLPEAEEILGQALRADDLTVFLQVGVLVAAALALLGADAYLDHLPGCDRAGFYALALFATTGMLVLVASGDLLTLFLGLELLSFPTYALCALRRDSIASNEAAMKYFVLGSFASGLFLYGVALVWGVTGTTSIVELGGEQTGPLFLLGLLLLLVGFLFKIGAAPFHMWVPDVYEGAPTPVTAFMATAVKVAAFGALVRVVLAIVDAHALPLDRILWWIACITMVIGNLSALTQENIKRMLAFSSVAHAGYMLVGLAAVAASGWETGAAAVLFYLLAYVFMSVGAFTIVMLLGRRVEGELVFDRDWSGTARRHPFLGIAMTVFMLGLGGIPTTGGFFGKYALFKSAMDAGLTSLVVIAVVNSVVSIYYYLRVVVAMYMRAERAPVPGILEALGQRTHALQGPGAMAAEAATVAPRLAVHAPWSARWVVLVCLIGTLWLGLAPTMGRLPGLTQVLEWAEAAVASAH